MNKKREMENNTVINNYTMYVFVNNELKMGKGKIGAQIGHVVMSLIEHLLNNKKSQEYSRYLEWKKYGQAKIILKATENDLVNLAQLPESKYVLDAGKTQIAPGSLTVVGFFPNTHEEFKKYKLL